MDIGYIKGGVWCNGASKGKGVLHQNFGTQVQHTHKNLTQSDLRFCENERSKRFKINEKGVNLDRKLRENYTKCFISVK